MQGHLGISVTVSEQITTCMSVEKPGRQGPIRVLLADDHKLVRAGFRAMLTNLSNVEVIAETGDGREALDLICKHRPDVAFIDITMPSLTGLEVARRVSEIHGVHVIIVSMHTTEDYIARAIRAGVSGYVLKNADPVELELAIRAAVHGEVYLSPAVSKNLIEDYSRRLAEDEKLEDQLTSRQREVLQLIAEGQNTKDIAQRLNLSVKTVETHRKQLMDRLDIHDVAGLVRYAIRARIIAAE
jgi:DNA-binding NarL/FixJ family response regulator